MLSLHETNEGEHVVVCVYMDVGLAMEVCRGLARHVLCRNGIAPMGLCVREHFGHDHPCSQRLLPH